MFDENAIPYMIIGGYALAYYGRVRATIDIDIAIAIESRDFDDIIKLLEKNNFATSLVAPANPCFIVYDKEADVEIEVWRKPDGIEMDSEVLRRRRKITTSTGLSLWIIGPENFIVNKLARPDRGAIDEADVASVLIKQKNNLDYEYLYNQARKAKVLELLKSIQQRNI